MDQLHYFIDFFLHLDKHLDALVQSYGNTTYLVLFLIVFCETGLVVTPFLPGDSLLFAAGALASGGSLNVGVLAISLFVAAVLGDALNYSIGAWLGPRVVAGERLRIIKREHLEKTQRFYDRYGPKTIVIARFVPIVRTFAPFLAGVGQMKYTRFAIYNVTGAFVWVGSLVFAGYFFGQIPFVARNFSTVVLAIIVISILPAIVELWRARTTATSSSSSSK